MRALKLIIDIDENTREYLYDIARGRILPLGDKLSYELQAELVKSIVDGTPIPWGYTIGLAGGFDKTLEDIKAEIEQRIPKCETRLKQMGLEEALEIIDNHIGERSE